MMQHEFVSVLQKPCKHSDYRRDGDCGWLGLLIVLPRIVVLVVLVRSSDDGANEYVRVWCVLA
jgi:hypothetical protein